jgi:hypothetical protein
MKFHPNIFDTVEDNSLFKLLSGQREVDLEMRSFDDNDNRAILNLDLFFFLLEPASTFVAHCADDSSEMMSSDWISVDNDLVTF